MPVAETELAWYHCAHDASAGAIEMVLSVTVGCVLQLILVLKCGSWARDLLGG